MKSCHDIDTLLRHPVSAVDALDDVRVAAMSTPDTRVRHDVLLISLAIGGVGLAVACTVVGALGLLPSPLAVVAVLAVATVALRFAVILRARNSTALSNPRVMNIVSWCGLGLSGFAALVTLGMAMQVSGLGDLLADLGLHTWSLLLLMAAAAPVRTIGWRALAGVGLAGLLASSALAREVGTPIVDALGADNVFATSIWVPVTEEVFKAAPVAIIALLAVRNRTGRPSAIDMALLGAFAGSGFTIVENVEFARSWGDWNAAPPLSLLFPSMERVGDGTAVWDAVAGHTIWTALFALGLGFGILYFRRFRLAWIAIPTTFLLVVVEHGIGNAGGPIPFGGALSAIVLVLAFGGLVVWERLALHGLSGFRDGLLVSSTTTALRRVLFAQAQQPRQTAQLTAEARAGSTPSPRAPEPEEEVNK